MPGLDGDPSTAQADVAIFSAIELATGELAGEALLWAIDAHNRSAHVGIQLRPVCRGRGLGADVVRVLCRYGFHVRGLRRLQLETLADNHAMIAVAEKLGFTREGATRDPRLVLGERKVYGRRHLRVDDRRVHRLNGGQSVLIIHSAAYACTSVCARGRLEIRGCAHLIHSYPQL